MLDARNVVVRAPNALGDLVMATPAFARLASHYGRERLTLICLPAGVPLLAGNTWFHEVLPYDRKGLHAGLGGSLAFARQMRARRFDLGIILPNSLGSAFQFLWGGVKRRVGYFKEGRRFLLHAGRPRDHDKTGKFVPKYTGQYFMDLLDVMGLPPGPLKPELTVTPEESAAAADAMGRLGLEGGPLVIIAPGAAFGPSKLWPADRFAAVGDALARQGCKILLSGGPGEEATLDSVARVMETKPPTSAGLNLGVLKAVMANSALVLTNDTGPRHVAVALGRPVVCIMGPNDPRYSALPGFERGEVIRQAVDCSPYTWPCQLKDCPIDHRCMNEISVDRVLAACLAQIA